MSTELATRIQEAIHSLEVLFETTVSPNQKTRLKGKIEGVKLVLSYIEEEERMEAQR